MLSGLVSRAGGLACRLVAVVGLAVALGVGAQVVHAQPGGGGLMQIFGGGMGGMGGGNTEATYSSRDVDKAAELIGFDAAQKEGAKLIFDAYSGEFQEAAARFRKEQEKAREAFREDQDPAAFENMRKEGEKLLATRTKLDKDLMTNMQALLTDAQKPMWPKFEMTQRRDKGLDRGAFMSGERLNLFTLTEKIEMPSENKAQVNTLLASYEVDLDRELINRAKVQEEIAADGQKMMQGGRNFRDILGGDGKEIDALINKAKEASVRVREVNRSYAKKIESALPEDKRADFAAEIQKQSYPQVYRQTRAQRQIVAAIGFGDLTPEQKTSIEAIRDNYTRELAEANKQLAAAQDKTEMEMSFEKMTAGFMGGGQNQGPEAELRKKKTDLNTKTEASLKSLLTDEQSVRLPTGGDDGGGRGPRGGGGGGGGGGGNDGGGGRRPRGGGGGGGGF